jgi:hypothetical protein
MAVSGNNYGPVFQSNVWGTSSAVSGSAPTDVGDGQPLDGLYGVTLVVSVPSGITLSGAGTLQGYVLDSGFALQAVAKATAASNTGTTIVLVESGLTTGFVVGMVVTGLTSGATGIVTAIGGTGNKTLTCSGGVTGTVTAGEVIQGVDPSRWARDASLDTATVTSGVRDCMFASIQFTTPRKGRALWVPNGVTFSSGSGGVITTQLGQTAAGLHNAGWWGG